jgi:hypothetical protein
VGSLQLEWDKLPANVKTHAENAVKRLAQAKALRLAGLSSETVLTPNDERMMLALLANVSVYGKLTLKELAISSVNNVLMKALEFAGSALRKLIGL